MSDKDKMNTGGTPLYMPPEMFQLKPETTEKCDVYAFGISKSFDLNDLVLELPNSWRLFLSRADYKLVALCRNM